jgi:hypothetical protein
MMGSLILVAAMMGMIQAITICSEMLATARRQTLAAQIINHEIEKLRFSNWTTISGLAAGPTAITIDTQFDSAITGVGLAKGTTITLSRSVSDVVSGSLREVTFTVTWQKSGTTAAASTPGGSWFDQLAFSRPSSISRTYTRVMSGYYGKNGLNSTYQRS